MTNPYGITLDNASLRWAAAEGVPETVIAAVLLLHEKDPEEVVPRLRSGELEQVIKLVGRCPTCYPPGTLDALKQRRTVVSPHPPSDSALAEVRAKEQPERAPDKRGKGADPPQNAEHKADTSPEPPSLCASPDEAASQRAAGIGTKYMGRIAPEHMDRIALLERAAVTIALIVRDKNGQAFAYAYYENEPGWRLRSAACKKFGALEQMRSRSNFERY